MCVDILSKVHDRAVVVGGVQVVCFKLFKISQPVYFNEQKNKWAMKWLKYDLNKRMLLYLSIYWTTWWWHTCPGQLGIAHEQNPGRALARGPWPPTRCSRASGGKWFVDHHVLQDMTSTWMIRHPKMIRFTQNAEVIKPLKKNLMSIPSFGLNIQVVPLVSSRHKAHTSVLFNELHAFLNALYVFLAYTEEQLKAK